MNNRIWVLATAILVVAILALGWLLGVAPRLAEVAASSEQIVAAEAQNALLEADIADLKKKFEELDLSRDEILEIRKALPPHADEADFLRIISELAVGSGVSVGNILINDPAGFVPGAFAESGGPVVEISPLVTAENLLTIPITVSVLGDLAQVLKFVGTLQDSERITTIDALNVAYESATGLYSTTLNGFIYVLIDPTWPGLDASDGATPPVDEAKEEEAAVEEEAVESPEPTDTPSPEPTETAAP
jgi:Tfp pilus assembly protein PilO